MDVRNGYQTWLAHARGRRRILGEVLHGFLRGLAPGDARVGRLERGLFGACGFLVLVVFLPERLAALGRALMANPYLVTGGG